MEANPENKCTLQSGFFTWLVSQEACLTLETLQKTDFTYVYMLFMCRQALQYQSFIFALST